MGGCRWQPPSFDDRRDILSKKDKEKEYIHDDSVGTMADVEAVMKKYDRESNTRIWEGWQTSVIHYNMAAFDI